jgi:hypothetical protein
VEEEQEEQVQDVYDNDDDDDDDQEISCGSGVPSSAHGGHTRRDGDAVLLQLEVGVGGDVWGAKEEKKRRENTNETELETKFVLPNFFFNCKNILPNFFSFMPTYPIHPQYKFNGFCTHYFG